MFQANAISLTCLVIKWIQDRIAIYKCFKRKLPIDTKLKFQTFKHYELMLVFGFPLRYIWCVRYIIIFFSWYSTILRITIVTYVPFMLSYIYNIYLNNYSFLFYHYLNTTRIASIATVIIAPTLQYHSHVASVPLLISMSITVVV